MALSKSIPRHFGGPHKMRRLLRFRGARSLCDQLSRWFYCVGVGIDSKVSEVPTRFDCVIGGSPLRLLRPLIPMLEPQHLLDVQPILARTTILHDPVDQHRDFWHRWIHAVQQPQFEWQRDFREPLRPVRLDLAVFDLLGARDDWGSHVAPV